MASTLATTVGMPRHVRIAGAVAVLLLIMTFGLVMSPTQAQAASCSGSSCNGKDPDAQGCGNDARYLGPVTYLGPERDKWGSIATRYSPNCRAVWTRLIVDPTSYALRYFRIRIERQAGAPFCSPALANSSLNSTAPQPSDCFTWWTTHRYYKTLNPNSPGTYWTPMAQRTGGDERHRWCYQWRNNSTGGWYSPHCSGWRY